ncbi:hypothetical protein BDB01DRAFT_892856 [Pilobolus umbonatus]|nr:hypothetical protein BDB01DRAFT_892856 [Pilobolus umbonatus]
MVHLRCHHLHSRVRQNVNQRILLQWRLLISSYHCQLRQASHRAPVQDTKVNDLLAELDQSLEYQLQQNNKIISKRRIPVNVVTKINAHLLSPLILSIHSHLESGNISAAWRIFDESYFQLSQQKVSHNTASLLLSSLHSEILSNNPRLFLDFGKLEKKYFDRLEILNGLVRKGGQESLWDKNEFGIVLEIYGRLNQIERAESIFRNMSYYCKDKVSVDIYNKLLSTYIRRFKYVDELIRRRYLSKMMSLEAEMVRKGLQPDTTSYNLLIAAKIKLFDLQGAEKLYAKMKTPPDRTTYNILLNGFLKHCRNNNDREVANEWMERLISSGIVPSKKTFINIMDGLSELVIHHANTKEYADMNSAVNSISSLHKVMLQLGHKTDTMVVNTLLKCYTAANDSDNIDKMVGLLAIPEAKSTGCASCSCAKESTEDIKRAKINPDTYTFNILIHHYLKQQNTNQAFVIYDKMVTSNNDPDTVTYANFIWYYARQGDAKECLKYLDVMKRKGIPMNNYIYNNLLDCSLKNPQHSKLIQPHLMSLLSHNINADSVTHNIQLSRQDIRNSSELDKDFEIYKDILDQSIFAEGLTECAPSTRTYNTLLHTSGKFLKKTNTAHQYAPTIDSIMDSLDTSNIRPDIFTYALSIRNYTYMGEMNKAESLYQSMLETGAKPNTYIFSHLIYGYSLIGKMDRALEVLQKMSLPPFNIKPNAINYAPLIKAFAESGQYEKAQELFQEMMNKNISADIRIYTILAKALMSSPVHINNHRTINLLEGISKSGLKMDETSLTLLAQAYGEEGYNQLSNSNLGSDKKASDEIQRVHCDKIDEIYGILKANNWVEDQAITVLLKSYFQIQKPEAAWKLWNELKKDHSSSLNQYHYNSFLTGLLEYRTWYPLTKFIYEDMLDNKSVGPDQFTFDLMIWAAYTVSDYENIRKIWNSPYRIDQNTQKPFSLLVRSYYAAMAAMLQMHDFESAKEVYREFQQISTLPPSTIFWVRMINKLVTHNNF